MPLETSVSRPARTSLIERRGNAKASHLHYALSDRPHANSTRVGDVYNVGAWR